jgi:hypothetical protein
MNQELFIQRELLELLKADAALQTILGDRIWDAPPGEAGHPHLTLGPCESRPAPADGDSVEHLLTLTVVSSFQGTEEAKAAVSAIRRAVNDARPENDELRAVSLSVRFSDVWRSPAGHRTFAVLRVRAVTEPI